MYSLKVIIKIIKVSSYSVLAKWNGRGLGAGIHGTACSLKPMQKVDDEGFSFGGFNTKWRPPPVLQPGSLVTFDNYALICTLWYFKRFLFIARRSELRRKWLYTQDGTTWPVSAGSPRWWVKKSGKKKMKWSNEDERLTSSVEISEIFMEWKVVYQRGRNIIMRSHAECLTRNSNVFTYAIFLLSAQINSLLVEHWNDWRKQMMNYCRLGSSRASLK